MRELGRFAEAKVLLVYSFSKDLSKAIKIISGLVKQQVISVKKM
jgi:hypothetical protein